MPSKKPKGPAFHVARVRDLIKKDPEAWKRHITILNIKEFASRRSAPMRWIDNRNYQYYYNPFFGYGLAQFFGARHSLDIARTLAKIPRGKNRKLAVLEDGAGKGLSLYVLKKKLAALGVESKTTALVLQQSPGKELETRVKERKVDKVIYGPAEFYSPKGKFDAIISLNGSFNYAPDSLKKEHLLKFAKCLRKGGIMMVGFTPEINSSNKTVDVFERRKKISQIIKAFEKRGFKAAHYDCQHNKNIDPFVRRKLPTEMLIIQRTNIQPKKN